MPDAAAAGRRPAAGAMSARANGFTARWMYRLHRVLQRLSGGRAGLQIYLFCAQPTVRSALADMRDDPRTAIVPVPPGSPLTGRFPRPAHVIARRYADGAVCRAVVVKDQFAGYLWLIEDAYVEDEVRCRYLLPAQPRSVWDFDVYIEPAYRAGRTMARLWKATTQDLRDAGVAWSFSRISLYNPASIQSHERLGALQVGSAAFLFVGALQIACFTSPPYVHAGWRAAPDIQLAAPPQNAGT